MKKLSFIAAAFLLASFVIAGSEAHAALTDTRLDWNLFDPPSGYTIPYTFNGQPVSDEEGSSDSSNGGTAVSPSSIDLSSGSPNGADPGTYDTPSYGYYDGGTPYDINDPTTLEDDYIRFTMRLAGDPSSGTQATKTDFASYHWNVLFDVDGDGYKEFWIDLNGSYASGNNQYDQLQILYDNENDQDIADPTAARVAEFTAYNYDDAGGISHTRVRAAGDGTGDYFIDIQVPMTAFKDLLGNQVLYPNSPVGFVFSTSSSNINPLQKDFMTDLNFLTENDPIQFGDIIKSNGEPDLYFANLNLDQVYSYTQGDDIYLYLRDVFANTDQSAVDTVTVTVTNPATGDDETVTLTETGPNTGIFSNRGGYDSLISSDPSTAWIPFVKTSIVANDETWTLTHNAGTGTWTVVGSLSGTQSTTATAGTEYTSDDGSVTFTVYENGTPLDGATITFDSYAGDPLTSSALAGTDDDGDLQVASGQTIYYTYTNSSGSFSDSVPIVGPGEPFIQFTRADGSPSNNFTLATTVANSDKFYVTVYHYDSNTDPATAETITISLSGNDSESTVTLTETGPDTGIFRNTTGLDAKVSDGTITADDALWEDVDGGVVTATFNYLGTDYTNTATIFTTNAAGRVNFTNGAGTLGVTQYAVNQPIFIRVEDEVACTVTVGGIETLTVTVTSTAGDSETITLYETAPGSAVFMNRKNDLVTTASSTIVTSSSSTFFSDGVLPGDYFIIATGPDTGTYTVSAVIDENTLILTQTLTSTRTAIGFNSGPLMTATSDGSFAIDSILESDHNDTITASYTDCADDDLDTTNDIKTDTATYNAPPIVINEVLFHPETTATYTEYEYVQLYNSSNSNVNVTGYSISDTDGFTYSIPQFTGKTGDPMNGTDITLQPGEKLYIVLVEQDGTGQTTPESDYDSVNGIYYVYTLVDAASGITDQFNDPNSSDPADQITLYDSTSTAVDYTGWSSTSPNSSDFLSDDSDAVLNSIWQDNTYKDVTGITAGQAITRVADGYDTDQPSDWTYTTSTVMESFLITHAVISSFNSEDKDRHLKITWETASEVGTAGFDLMRLDTRSGTYIKVNRLLLPASPGSLEGASYSILDRKTKAGGTYTYKLIEVEHDGNRRVFGPYTVGAGAQGGTLSNSAVYGTAVTSLEPGNGDVYIMNLEDGTVLVTDDPTGFRRTRRSGSTATGTVSVRIFESSAPRLVKTTANESDLTFRIEPKHSKKSKRPSHAYRQRQASATAKLVVTESGVHYVSAAELGSALGLSVEETGRLIRSGRITITHMGDPVAYLSAGTGGLFFIGSTPDSPYTDENVYVASKGKGLTMRKRPHSPHRKFASEGQTSFVRSVHAEKDRYAATALFSDPQGDYWLWDYIVAGFPELGSKSFELVAPSIVDGSHEAVLTVHFMGVTSTEGGPDHFATISVNGTHVGETSWDGINEYSASFSFDQALLASGTNTVTITGSLMDGVPYSIFYVDSIDLDYQSAYRASGDTLEFSVNGRGPVTLSGFTNSDILVLPTGNDRRSSAFIPSKGDAKTGELTLTHAPQGSYIAITPEAAFMPLIMVDEPSALHSPDNKADYVVITTPEFRDAAVRLTAHRESRGLTPMVVMVEDVMDEFGYGINNPDAIQRFISHAYSEWAMQPRYVLLLGEGSYDYRNHLGYGTPVVPPMMTGTTRGLFPSDSVLSDVDGDSVPDLAVGRLPASTPEEASGMIDKILAYEAGGSLGWKKRVLFMTDEPDGLARFDRDSDTLATLVPDSYEVVRSYLSEWELYEARSIALKTITDGVAFANYFGHGGVERISSHGLITSSDASKLTNGNRPTVFTAMTCVVGNFGIPGYDSLGVALVKNPAGGAAAVWSPSGMSQTSKANILAEGFYDAALNRNALTLGDAMIAALKYYAGRTRHTDLLRVYNLLGDPAMRLR